MSCVNTAFSTKGVQLTASAVAILPWNIHRKGLLLSAPVDGVEVAFGEAPVALDYFKIPVGTTLVLDILIPAQTVWAKGAGVLVYGEAK